MSKIYRFISFESFVDMIMKQSLTFVHPTLWDDPYELNLIESKFKKTIDSSDSISTERALETILQQIITNKLYCQSWTKLNESDALWRIYNNNNTSVRIEVDLNDISKLENVEDLEVEYVDDPITIVEKDSFYDLIKIKRKAFAHENEIRLLTHYKFNGTEDAKEHIKDYLKLSGDYESNKNSGIEEISTEVERIISKLNLNQKDKTFQVYYGHIDNFIKSVMLNPFAPEWFNGTLRMFCEQNGINYLGKSELYKLNK
ncbi:hypothetical protein [Halobacillus amylolyticus]|uniref:DUF2971 domain-containing protein n=1 Tax=Halobacillus amylolyticus TaxID=2932259 RepID=A0ABY4HDD7_9BACI|nr:hypothetical protein [Halobacillus amylolyticus]UOR12634.1 hypothetical protein MUO15_03685 [Halobacillus amylolyticus]